MKSKNTVYSAQPLDKFQSGKFKQSGNLTVLWSESAEPVKMLLRAAGLVLVLTLFVGVAVGVVPMFFGLRSFVVLSGSMEPTISTGSVVITQPVANVEIEVGDVIAYRPREDTALPVIHRVVGIEHRNGTTLFTTRGDGNNGTDAPMALSSPALIVLMSIPYAGYLVYFAAQPLGTVLLIWVPLVLLVALGVADYFKRKRARNPRGETG